LKQKRQVYIVTRICRCPSESVLAIPNLGVYFSLKKATAHYRSVVESRKKGGAKCYWERRPDNFWDKNEIIIETYIQEKDGTCENIFIECWRI
jgi:hypothetical protein